MAKVPGIDEVAVVGAGWMGSGITTVCSLGEYKVNLIDVSADLFENCLLKVRHNLNVLVMANEISASDAERAFGQIRTTTSMEEGLTGAGLAIEAVPERLEMKQAAFAQMEAVARPGTILGTNASGIPTTQIAEHCAHPEQVVGIHFFEPPIALRAVEIIRGERTSDETLNSAAEFIESLGWVPIKVLKDRRSFVINFLQGAMRKAVEELMEAGVTTEEELLKAARYSFGVKYAATGTGASRGGASAADQYKPEWLDEMDRRALAMLTVARAARSLDEDSTS